MIRPDYTPGLGIGSGGRGADIPLRESGHKARNSFTGSELKFKTKRSAVENMRGNGEVAIVRRK